jgi:hypothetical protein
MFSNIKAENHLDTVTFSPIRAQPQPYWRGRVSENMMYHPDIVTANSYTVCWQGVVSTYVCTSGAGTILNNWYVEGKRWQPQLTTLLGSKAYLDLYNDPDGDKVRRYCDEYSVLLFPLKRTPLKRG